MQAKKYGLPAMAAWLGIALIRRLQTTGAKLLIAGRADVDLRRQEEVERWMAAEKPQAIFLAAAKGWWHSGQ